MKSTLRKYLIGGTAIAARGLGGLAWASSLTFSTPAFADCTGDVCGALQKILQARWDNFAKWSSFQKQRSSLVHHRNRGSPGACFHRSALECAVRSRAAASD